MLPFIHIYLVSHFRLELLDTLGFLYFAISNERAYEREHKSLLYHPWSPVLSLGCCLVVLGLEPSTPLCREDVPLLSHHLGPTWSV